MKRKSRRLLSLIVVFCLLLCALPMRAFADKQEEIDAVISSKLKKGWSIRRLSKPSLAILRLAVYEINYLENIPDGVAVNEAVELAKKYTIDESGFINGILGSVIREKEGKK